MGKMTLEELLNKLIEKGWEPFGRKDTEQVDEVVIGKSFYLIEEVFIEFVKYDYKWEINAAIYSCSIRELVSKESWLWKFVCENGMVEIEYWKIREKYDETKDKVITFRNLLWEDNYEYRLIESALCDEDKLEEFLLDNIKI